VSKLDADYLIARLKSRAAWLCTAESCTGGLIASRLTDVAGSSDSYWGGWVVYDNSAKTRLGVHARLLETHGAVSEPVAKALAETALADMRRVLTGSPRRATEFLALATTGIAGPTGGTPDKPAGLCWIACATATGTRTARVETGSADRLANKSAFADAAFALLNACLT
jgi:PncC family amidohydrolase